MHIVRRLCYKGTNSASRLYISQEIIAIVPNPVSVRYLEGVSKETAGQLRNKECHLSIMIG